MQYVVCGCAGGSEDNEVEIQTNVNSKVPIKSVIILAELVHVFT